MEIETYFASIETVQNKYFYSLSIGLLTTITLNDDGTINKCEACYAVADENNRLEMGRFATEKDAIEWAKNDQVNCKY